MSSSFHSTLRVFESDIGQRGVYGTGKVEDTEFGCFFLFLFWSYISHAWYVYIDRLLLTLYSTFTPSSKLIGTFLLISCQVRPPGHTVRTY